MVRELLVVESGDQLVGGIGQGQSGLLGDPQCRVQGLQGFLADGELFALVHTVGLGEPLGELVGQRSLTLCQQLFDGLTVICGDVDGVVAPAGFGEQVVDDHQLAELLHPVVRQVVRQPHHGEGGVGQGGGQLGDAGVVFSDGVVGFVEGVVDDQA